MLFSFSCLCFPPIYIASSLLFKLLIRPATVSARSEKKCHEIRDCASRCGLQKDPKSGELANNSKQPESFGKCYSGHISEVLSRAKHVTRERERRSNEITNGFYVGVKSRKQHNYSN
jgi:hypothetical protein